MTKDSAKSDGKADQLLPLLYTELRRLAGAKMAREQPGQTLQATMLVHEAYLRLARDDVGWNSRGHFMAAAAEAMRRILVGTGPGAPPPQTGRRSAAGGGRRESPAGD